MAACYYTSPRTFWAGGPKRVSRPAGNKPAARPPLAARSMSHPCYYTGPATFMDLLLEAGQYLDACAANPEVGKQDVIDSMVQRLSMLTGKMVTHPTANCFSILRHAREPEKEGGAPDADGEEDFE